MYHRLRRPPALLLTLALASPLACGDDEQVTTTDSGTGSDSDDSTTTDGSTSDPTTSTSDPSGSESESTTAGTTEVTTDPTTDPSTTDPSTTSSCDEGDEGCACLPGDVCDDPLVCVEGLCEAMPPPACGDGNLDAGEECDDGPANDDNGACKTDCTLQYCGDGLVGPGEACDDGNDIDDDACPNDCVFAPCGDGLVDAGEECDDGNADNEDACLDTCVAASCGDAYVYAGVEECDDGNIENTDACVDGCIAAVCGDSFVYEGVEQCDDGNADNDDACVDGCVAAACGDGFVQTGVEQCDDGNLMPGDGCDDACMAEVRQVFLTSSNGDVGFYEYDIATNTWATRPNPPTTSRTQITNDGALVYLMGANNTVYSYNPQTQQWLNVMAGPGNETASPIGYFQWVDGDFYYLKDGSTTMRHYDGNGWTSFQLGVAGSSSGTWDAVNNELYIRTWFQMGFQVINPQTNTVVRTITDATNVGENSRTGSYYDGFFYARTFTESIQRLDAQNGNKTNTGADPISDHTASDTDFGTGRIYIHGYGGNGTIFQVFDTANNQLTTLAPSANVSNHSTITVLRAP